MLLMPGSRTWLQLQPPGQQQPAAQPATQLQLLLLLQAGRQDSRGGSRSWVWMRGMSLCCCRHWQHL